jgi:uncharacterized integral membrane protein (TIGR00698 family)
MAATGIAAHTSVRGSTLSNDARKAAHNMARSEAKPPHPVLDTVPGLALTAVAVAVAWAANQRWSALSPLTAAVILGVIAANTLPKSVLVHAQPGLAVAAKRLMRAGIVLLGLQLALGDVLKLGWESLVLVVVVVFATFFGTRWLGNRIGLPGRQPLLIATGFAICGASAVAAMDSVTRRRDTPEEDPDPVVAVALVTLCGSLAILVLPLLQGPLGLSDVQFGHWVGASVHDVGQVVATAGVGGAVALQPAVVVKLMRVAMLAPMVAGTALRARKHDEAGRTGGTDESGEAGETESKRPPILPLFVVGFLAMIALRTTGWLPVSALGHAKQAQDLLLAAGMFGLGAGVRVRELVKTGVKPLLLGLASWVLIAAVAYCGVLLTT